MILQSFIDRMADLAAAGMLAAFGGAASVLYSHVKDDKPLSVTLFVINILLAGFVGQLVGSLIPHDFAYRDGLLLSAGFCTFPILGLVQTYTTAGAEKLMSKIVGKL
jgi:hypothetical protein